MADTDEGRWLEGLDEESEMLRAQEREFELQRDLEVDLPKVQPGSTCGCGRTYQPGVDMGGGSLCPFGDCQAF